MAYLDIVAEKRRKAADEKKRQDEQRAFQDVTKSSGKEVVGAVYKQAAKTRSTTQPVEVRNSDWAKGHDIQGVVDSINHLNVTAFLATQDKYADMSKKMLELCERLETLAANISERGKGIDTSLTKAMQGVGQISDKLLKADSTNSEVQKLLKQLIAEVRGLEINPVVNVSSPDVVVPAPIVDLTSLEAVIKTALTPKKVKQRFDLAGYIAHDLDNAPDGKQYIGFVDSLGSWFIKENDDENNKERYFFGSMGYEQAWDDRYSHKYKILDKAIA